MAAPVIASFDTDTLPPPQRFAYWAEEFTQRFGRMVLDSPERQSGFRQSVASLTLGGLFITRASGSPLEGVRHERDLAYGDAYPFQIVRRQGPGVVEFCAGGRQALLSQGQMVVTDNRRGGRFCSHGTTDTLVVALSKELADRWLPPGAAGAYNELLAADGGWSRTLSAYLGTLDLEALARIGSPAEAGLVADHVGSLLAFTLTQHGYLREPETVSSADMAAHGLHGRMLAWLRENHTQLELDAARLAAHFNVSVRYVHAVFAKATPGRSFLRTLLEMRLETAMRLLRSPAAAQLTIAGVGLRSGFVDGANFSRVFRARHGFPPGHFRRVD